jgi:hypothetical protein
MVTRLGYSRDKEHYKSLQESLVGRISGKNSYSISRKSKRQYIVPTTLEQKPLIHPSETSCH